MTLNDSFEDKLKVGQKVEKGIIDLLTKLLPPGYTVLNTDQTRGSVQREDYSLIDVVILKDKNPVLGIECKRTQTELRNSWKMNNWSPLHNTVINGSSLRKYQEADFPYWIINVQEWAHRVYAAHKNMVLSSRCGPKIYKKTGGYMLNICTETWYEYKGEVKMKKVLEDILKKEKIC